MQAAVSGMVAALIYGKAEGTFSEGVLSARIPPGGIAVFRILSARETGLYVGNVLYTVNRPRTVVFEAHDRAVAALYRGNELLAYATDGTRMDGEGKIKIFRWNQMCPVGSVQEVAYAD